MRGSVGVRVREKVKGSGEWWVFVHWRSMRASSKIGTQSTADAVATEISRMLAIASAKGLAGADLKAVLKQAAGVYDTSAIEETDDVPTLGQYGVRWLAFGSSTYGWKPKTVRGYKGQYDNYIYPRWSDVPLDQITRRPVRAWLAGLATTSKLAPDSVRAVYRVLSSLLSAAVDDEYLEANPIQRLGRVLPAVRKQKRPPRVWTLEQVGRILKAARDVATVDEVLMLETTAAMGLRISELCGMYWTDVDLERGEFLIHRTLVEGHEGSTKNRGYRVARPTPHIPCSVGLLERLQALRAAQDRRHVKRGRPKARPWVFQGPKGAAIRANNFRNRSWARILKRAKVPDHGSHGFRHTYVSVRLRAGDNLFDVSRAIGHSGIAITADTYGHIMADEKPRAVVKLAREE